MEVFISYVENDESYVPLLFGKKMFLNFAKNSDGGTRVSFKSDKNKIDTVKELISDLNCVFLTKKNLLILNLLINPFFDELCSLIDDKSIITEKHKEIIKKYIFSYLASDETNQNYSRLPLAGSLIYKSKNMYLKSKKILETL